MITSGMLPHSILNGAELGRGPNDNDDYDYEYFLQEELGLLPNRWPHRQHATCRSFSKLIFKCLLISAGLDKSLKTASWASWATLNAHDLLYALFAHSLLFEKKS
jgi:hypothetical protein